MRVCLSFVSFFCVLSLMGQKITGKVIDNSSLEPLPYANIVLLNHADSSFITGTTTDNGGFFRLQAENGEYLLRVSFIGYETQIILVNDSVIGEIHLDQNTSNLTEITVEATRPIIRMEKRGISIDIQNGVLKEIGSAVDVLGQIPLVNIDKTNVTVFGKGTPLIYINNRQVRDLSELESLNSNLIMRVSVITNPGSEYSATVKSIIRIETLKPEGEGLTGNIMGNLVIKRKLSENILSNLNYRKNNLDIFGLIYYYHGKEIQNIDCSQSIFNTNKTVSVNESNKRSTNLKSYRFNLGANYVFNTNHSLGMRYENGDYPTKANYNSSLTAFVNNDMTNEIKSLQERENERTRHYINAYYSGKITSWITMKLDVDYIDNKETSLQSVINDYTDIQERIATKGNQRSDLFASKLVFITPIAQDNLIYGGEFARTNNDQSFLVSEYGQTQELESNNSLAKQNLMAIFMNYSKSIENITIDLGLRYENVEFNYFVNDIKQESQSKSFREWFPNLNLTYSIKDIQFMFGYAKSIYRPSYYQLRNNVEYNSPYSYEAGNPYLKPSINNSFSSSIKWKNFLFNANYDFYKDITLLTMEPLTDEILLSKTENFDNFRNVSLSSFYSTSIGIWKPSLEVSFNKNIFSYGNPSINYGKPIYRVRHRSNFSLFHDINLGLDMIYTTSGHSQLDYMYEVFRMNMYAYKTFLKNRLRVVLQGNDILGTDRYKYLSKINNTSLYVLNDLDKSGIILSVSYNFNAVKSKYKGEQASDEINRL